MEHAVIPAPARFDVAGGRGFAFRPGTVIAYADVRIAPIVGRFCAQVARRTGFSLTPVQDRVAPDDPFVMIELSAGDDLDGLPAPAGLSPGGGDPADERYSLLIDADRIVVRAAEPAGVARALTTLIQLVATSPGAASPGEASPGEASPGEASTAEIDVPAARIGDGPRYAWRGLSLDVARAFFTVGEIRRVIDLLELYKLNVLHLHLTDDQAWRLPMGRPGGEPEPGTGSYSTEDLRTLAAYAADRFVTIVPEVDTPGHATALLRLHPELSTGRNEVDYEVLPGHPRHATWLDPELPATFGLMEHVLAGLAAIFPGPYLHIGADEPRGMPDDLYVAYVQRLRRLVRSLGLRPLGWQESARAGLGPDDVIQLWLTGIDLPPSAPPHVRAQVAAEVALARRDAEAVASASVPVIVSPLSHCYLDVPYAEPPGRHRTGRYRTGRYRTGRYRTGRYRAGGPARPPRPAGLRAQDRRLLVRMGSGRGPRPGPGHPGRGRRSRDLGRDHHRLRRPVLPAAAPAARRRPQGVERAPAGRVVRRLARSP